MSSRISRRKILARFAATVKAHRFTVVTLYGYAPSLGLASYGVSLSRARASAVAAFLRARLAALHVSVVVKAAGEGTIPGASAAAMSRVEVFAY